MSGNCKDCEYPDICLFGRMASDYLSPDGEMRQITGCDENKFFYGDILLPNDISEIKRKLGGKQ